MELTQYIKKCKKRQERYSFLILAFVYALLLGCGENDRMEIEQAAIAFDIEQARAAILQGNENFTKAFKNRDTLKLIQSYTSSGELWLCGKTPIENKDSLKAYYGGLFAMGITTFRLETTGIGGDSTLVAEEGTYIMEDTAGKDVDKGKYIVLWKRESGNWKKYRSLRTSNFESNSRHRTMKPAADQKTSATQ